GDSGGPLFQLNHKNKYALVGIASAGNLRCHARVHKRQDATFVNVKNYLDWICNHTGVCPIQQKGSHRGDGNLYKALMSNGKTKSPIEAAD
ncbi:hypothetical protein GCK32_018017, partial [Trichostrongylus colubriformis]